GPITSTQQLLSQAARFELSQPQAQSILEEVASAVKRWKDVATSAEVGLQAQELNDFKSAFKSDIK
ncbi:MAG: type II toxin-antitoxin system HipA family toxin, partial [Limnohabitans sp.]